MIQNLRGTQDFYPERMRGRQSLYNVMIETLEKFNYEAYSAPILEPFELYAAKSSSEIISEQAYTFTDRGGRQLVVRPEMTPTMARMIAAKQNELVVPLRWYTIANCWRYERPQKGRLRDFYQLNVDLLGSSDIASDVEVIATGLQLLRNIGSNMSAIKVELNDRGAMQDAMLAVGVTENITKDLFGLIDRRNKMEAVDWEQAVRDLGVSDDSLEKINAWWGEPATLLQTPAYERLRAVMSGLVAAGFAEQCAFTPEVVRGFDYYTSTVFEFTDTSGGFNRAIFGGGRYDNLLADVGGQPMTGIGYGASAEAIEALLEGQGVKIPDSATGGILVVPFSEEEVSMAADIAQDLRNDLSIPVALGMSPYDLKKQFKLADKKNYRYVILVSPDELAQNQVVLRDMQTGDQQAVDRADIINGLV